MTKNIFLFLFVLHGACAQQNDKKEIPAKTLRSKSQVLIPESSNQMTSTKKEILETIATWNHCFRGNEAENYFSYIHDDLTLFTPSNPYRIDGKQDDREEFEWSLRNSRSKVQFFQQLQTHVQLYDNTAVVTYYTRGVYGSELNPPMLYLKETDVLVKEDGKWKIVHIHVSK